MDLAPLRTVGAGSRVVLVTVGDKEDCLWHGSAPPVQPAGRHHLLPLLVPYEQVDHRSVRGCAPERLFPLAQFSGLRT